jgi:anti-sigma factor RsiW
MMHWRANRLVASLPDDTLPPEVAVEVEVHVASCAKCRQKLEEIEFSEQLMQAMPTALLPREWNPDSYRRLNSLARWSANRELPSPPGRWRAPVLSLVSAFAILVIAIMGGRYSPIEQSTVGPITISMTLPNFSTGTADFN